jgi:hypothetical protein
MAEVLEHKILEDSKLHEIHDLNKENKTPYFDRSAFDIDVSEKSFVPEEWDPKIIKLKINGKNYYLIHYFQDNDPKLNLGVFFDENYNFLVETWKMNFLDISYDKNLLEKYKDLNSWYEKQLLTDDIFHIKPLGIKITKVKQLTLKVFKKLSKINNVDFFEFMDVEDEDDESLSDQGFKVIYFKKKNNFKSLI